MPSWQGRSRGTPLGYRIFVTILKTGGLFPAYLLLRFVSLYFLFFSHTSSRQLFLFYRRRLHCSFLRSVAALYRNYNLFGESLIDRICLMSGVSNPLTFDFDGEEHLQAIARMGGGGLLLSAHIGNWDIAGHLLKRLDTPIHIVMFDGEHQQIKEYLDSVTGEKSVHVIIIKEDLSHIYEISEAFAKNELVCMHADRFLEGNKTKTATFIGRQAKFPLGPFILAATFKVPVSFVFAMKESTTHYHFFASAPKETTHLKKESVTEDIMQDFVTAMENKVRQYPLQWYNYYDFWQ